jgi:hypothetical protein
MPVVYEVAVQFGSVCSVRKKYVVWFGSVRQIPGSVDQYMNDMTDISCSPICQQKRKILKRSEKEEEGEEDGDL